MHDGCEGTFENGTEIADKVRMMGFDEQCLPMPLDIKCKGCGEDLEMETFITACPKCNMTHAVTPCHAFDPDNIQSAGIGY